MSLKQFIENRRASLNESTTSNYDLNEVKFNEKKLEKVAELYGKIMGKQMGGKFYKIGVESFKRRSGGSGRGIRTMNSTGEQLRFNWDAKLQKKGLFELTSIDYWRPSDRDFTKPFRRVELSQQDNVIQVLGKVTAALKTGHINEAQDIIDSANFIFEAKTSKQKKEWLKANNLPDYLSSPVYDEKMKKAAAKAGLAEALQVFLGEEETNEFEDKLENSKKQLKEVLYSDPETVFDDIEDLLTLIAAGNWNALLILGDPGIGKTYHIYEGPRSIGKLLGPEGDKWTYHPGMKASLKSFYKLIFMERDKCIIFDEADPLLKSAEIQLILKPLLDTKKERWAEHATGTQPATGKTHKELEDMAVFTDILIANGGLYNDDKTISQEDYNAKGSSTKIWYQIPGKFKFTGQMIFISNMSYDDVIKAGGSALLSRSIFIDVHLARRDVMKRIQTIGYNSVRKDPDLDKSDIDKILAAAGGSNEESTEENIVYITPELKRQQSRGPSTRTLELGKALLKSGLPNWENLLALYS